MFRGRFAGCYAKGYKTSAGREYADYYLRTVSWFRIVPQILTHMCVKSVELYSLRREHVHVACKNLGIATIADIVPTPVINEVCKHRNQCSTERSSGDAQGTRNTSTITKVELLTHDHMRATRHSRNNETQRKYPRHFRICCLSINVVTFHVESIQ